MIANGAMGMGDDRVAKLVATLMTGLLTMVAAGLVGLYVAQTVTNGAAETLIARARAAVRGPASPGPHP
jgi:hypothetical protein